MRCSRTTYSSDSRLESPRGNVPTMGFFMILKNLQYVSSESAVSQQ
jgi:hypothetical protein